jgi:hypothetical protein
MPEDDLSKGAAGSGEGNDNDGQQKDGNGEPVIFTDEQKKHVQTLIQTRLKGANKKIVDLEARLGAMEGAMTAPKTKDAPAAKKGGEGNEALTSLQNEIANLKAESAAAKAEAENAKINSLKLKMAKGKFPAWFDPTWLPGKTEEEIQASIDDKLEEMKAEAEGETVQRKKRGFGGPVPKGKGVTQTPNEYMNNLFLSKIGRGPAR